MSKHNSKLDELKKTLITAAIVVVGMQIVLWAIKPFLPLIFFGIVLVITVGWLFQRSRH